jgi:ABC-type amino acid transport substrate-binding protein
MAIPIDILRGLLGRRICLVTNATKNLGNIKRLEDLHKLRIGQTTDWADLAIYRNNGITPIEASTYESMFEMLSFNRFDCLALGANEILLAYREKKSIYGSLAIDNSLLISYEYPIYFYISKKFPELAERIKLGLEKIQRSGEFDQLFYKHFAKDLEVLALGKRNIICLQSPYLKPNQQTCPKPRDMDFITSKPVHKSPKIKKPLKITSEA